MACLSGLSLRRMPCWRSVWDGRDEGAAHVAVLREPLAVRKPALVREARGGRDPGVGDAHDEVGVGGRLARERLAHAATRLVHRAVKDLGVGPSEVDELEHAQRELLGRHGLSRLDALGRHLDRLAGRDVAHVHGAHDVEAARLARDDPATPVGQLAEDERTHAVRVAEGVERLLGHEHDRVRAGDELHRLGDAAPDVVALHRERADERRDDLGVGGRAEAQALALEGLAQLVRVHEVAVVGERDDLSADGRQVRLGVLPARGGAGGGVAGVADRDVAGQRVEVALAEHARDQAEVLGDGHGLVIAHGDARALLARGAAARAGRSRSGARHPRRVRRPRRRHTLLRGARDGRRGESPLRNAVSCVCSSRKDRACRNQRRIARIGGLPCGGRARGHTPLSYGISARIRDEESPA